jgi:hypothetical protein
MVAASTRTATGGGWSAVMTTTTEQKPMIVRPYHVMHLATLGFKVVPLAEDGKGSVIPWTPIYENGGWGLITLSKNYSLFEHGISTCFGLVVLPKSGEVYYLNCLDVDSQKAGDRLKSLIERAMDKTWVTKTKKGLHVYWLSTTGELAPVRTVDCMPGWEFELKTDNTGGLATLPPSRHRNDPNFIYENIGQHYIGISDEFYPVVLGKMKDRLFAKNDSWKPAYSGNNIPWPSITLTDDEIDEIAAVISAPNSGYTSGLRHQMSLAIAGFLCKNGVDYVSAKKVYEKVCQRTRDEEKRSRLLDLKETYQRAQKNDKRRIIGYFLLKELSSHLADQLTKIMSDIIRDKKRRKNESAA